MFTNEPYVHSVLHVSAVVWSVSFGLILSTNYDYLVSKHIVCGNVTGVECQLLFIRRLYLIPNTHTRAHTHTHTHTHTHSSCHKHSGHTHHVFISLTQTHTNMLWEIKSATVKHGIKMTFNCFFSSLEIVLEIGMKKGHKWLWLASFNLGFSHRII